MNCSSAFISLFCQVALFAECCVAQQTFVRSPRVGGGNTGFYGPFDLGGINSSSMRYQQVYAASDFLISMPQGGYINGIRFDVADAQFGGHPFATTLSNIQINLSTTPRAVDGLSTVFGENLGLDDTIVLGPRAIFLTDSVLGGADIIIPFTRPFFFNPGAGNLLMEVRNFAGGSASPFNANNVLGDTVSSVISVGSVNDAGGFLTTGGLVTVFDVTPVPEPSVVALGVTGLGMLGLWRCSRRFSLKKA